MTGIKDTILVVEDSLVEQITHVEAVKKANTGHKVLLADNLEAAKEALAKGNIAAVITDKAFPAVQGGAFIEDQGISLIEHIRKTRNDKDTPIQLNSSTLSQKNIDDLATLEGVPPPALTDTAPMQLGAKTQVINKNLAIDEIRKFIASEAGQSQGLGGITPSGDADGPPI